MVLKKSNAAVAPAGEFEPEDAVGSTPVAANDDTSAAAPAPAAASSQSTAVAARPATAVGAVTSLPGDTTWTRLKEQIPVDELAALGIGTFPRITVDTGGYKQDKTTSIGKKIRVEVVSWNVLHMVTTGEQNNTEANKLIRSSYDGINLSDGSGTVSDYVKHLRTEGYEKTEVKKYGEIYGNLVTYQEEDKDGNRKTVEVPVVDQKFVQVSLSPQSLSQWQAYQLGAKMRKLKGIEDSNVVVMVAGQKTLGANTFGFSTFQANW